MKTQMIYSVKTLATLLMSASLLALAGCGNNQQNASVDSEQSTPAREQVKPPSTDLHTATFLGDLDAIGQHIAAGSDLDAREPTMGSTALISAAVFGKTEVARALIHAGADVNLQNNEGSTALHSAAFLCRTEIVEMLLANGADKSLRNIYGSTPLAAVAAPFSEVEAIYDEFSKNLGPLGLRLDYAYLKEARPMIAALLQ